MFKFKFERILSIRKYEQEIIKNQLAVLHNEINNEKQKLKDLYLSQQKYNSQLSEISSGSLDISLMNSYRHYLKKITNDIELEKKIIIQISNEIETKKKKLTIAMQKVKVLEKLREKELEKFKKEEDFKEEQVLNEIGTTQFIRNLNEI